MKRRTFLQAAGRTTALISGVKYLSLPTFATQSTDGATYWNGGRGNAGRTGAISMNGPSGPYVTRKWEQGGTWFNDSPTIANGTAYVSDLTSDTAWTGNMEAYDVETGELKWTRSNINPNSEERDPLGWPTHVPVFSNGTLYYTSEGGDAYEWEFAGIYALNADNGEVKWRRADLIDKPRLEVTSNRVFLGSHTLDATSGETLWAANESEQLLGIADQAVYSSLQTDSISQNYQIIARDIRTGDELWRAQSPRGAAAVTPEMLFFTTRSDKNPDIAFVRGISTEDGSETWSTKAPIPGDGDRPYISKPVVDDMHVYCFTRSKHAGGYMVDDDLPSSGTVYAFDRETGEFTWRFETPAELEASPSVGGDTIYISARYHVCPETHDEPTHLPHNILYALNTETGAERWSYGFGGDEAYRSFDPSIGCGRIFITTRDATASESTIYAIEETAQPPRCNGIVADKGKTQTYPNPDEGDSTTTTEPPETTTQTVTTSESTETTTSSDGQAGLGFGTALVGLMCSGVCALRRVTDEEN